MVEQEEVIYLVQGVSRVLALAQPQLPLLQDMPVVPLPIPFQDRLAEARRGLGLAEPLLARVGMAHRWLAERPMEQKVGAEEGAVVYLASVGLEGLMRQAQQPPLALVVAAGEEHQPSLVAMGRQDS